MSEPLRKVPALWEALAALAHEQWSGWMKYVWEKSTLNPDGTVTIPKWAVDRWTRQLNTEYVHLTETEKESDRQEADRVLVLIVEDFHEAVTDSRHDGEE